MARDTRNVVNPRSTGGQGPHTRREAGDPRQTEDGGSNSSGYAGPIGADPIGLMNADPMDGAKAMDRMGELELRKKKKSPMDMDMNYAGPTDMEPELGM